MGLFLCWTDSTARGITILLTTPLYTNSCNATPSLLRPHHQSDHSSTAPSTANPHIHHRQRNTVPVNSSDRTTSDDSHHDRHLVRHYRRNEGCRDRTPRLKASCHIETCPRFGSSGGEGIGALWIVNARCQAVRLQVKQYRCMGRLGTLLEQTTPASIRSPGNITNPAQCHPAKQTRTPECIPLDFTTHSTNRCIRSPTQTASYRQRTFRPLACSAAEMAVQFDRCSALDRLPPQGRSRTVRYAAVYACQVFRPAH